MLTTLLDKSNSKLLKGKFNVENREIFNENISNLPLKKHTVVIHNKQILTPRKIGFFSNDSIGYRYTGNILPACKFDNYPFLLDILNKVNEYTQSDFNAILINKYSDGNDYIGPHSDDERNLANNGVVTISFGASRKFRIRDKNTKIIIKDVIVEDGDLYWMQGEFQKHFTHEIVKQLNVKDERISLTFRKHKV